MLQNGVLEGKNDDEKEAFLLNTKLFYFNRFAAIRKCHDFLLTACRMTGSSLTPEDVRAQNARQVDGSTSTASLNERLQPSTAQTSHLEQRESSASSASSSEPRPLSFAEIKELIEQGRTDQIPNNRVIPDELSVSYLANPSYPALC